MKDRTIICEYYICAGSCAKGKEASFATTCQHCKKYMPKAGSAPSRTDNRKRKLDKINKKELRRELY